ncbi:hypothetical protein EUX98_g2547 [Antrodiella citrinella]|uniref:Uncharacterized protein n=1 Tax=Antrodiella citrinella TaxID=2447956 RepID=A0A4S4N1Q5_9APHY|nr:hypothetical protein EUX98_g2547 [Antrodiella citrinella]
MDYNSTTAFFSAAAVSKDKEKQKAQENAQGKAKSEHIPSGTTTTTTSVSLYTPVMTLVLPDTTILSTLAPTTPRPTPTTPASPLAAAAVTTATATTATPAVVIQDQPEGPPERGGPGIGGRRKSSSATSTRRVDMEKVKFRVVFILWPVLIGLSMAL